MNGSLKSAEITYTPKLDTIRTFPTYDFVVTCALSLQQAEALIDSALRERPVPSYPPPYFTSSFSGSVHGRTFKLFTNIYRIIDLIHEGEIIPHPSGCQVVVRSRCSWWWCTFYSLLVLLAVVGFSRAPSLLNGLGAVFLILLIAALQILGLLHHGQKLATFIQQAIGESQPCTT